MSMYMRSDDELMLQEGVRAASLLRQVMSPAYPMALFANAPAREAIARVDASSLWDICRDLQFPPELQQALQPFDRHNRTRRFGHLFWEAQRPSLNTRHNGWLLKLAALLSAGFSRVVYIDNDVYVVRPSLVHSLLSQTLRFADVAAPLDPARGDFFSAAGVPPLCAGMIAYHAASPAVRALLVGAAVRLASGSVAKVFHRTSDQEGP